MMTESGWHKGMRVHKSVLVGEVLEAFGLEGIAPLKIAGKYIDATLGHAGHAIAIAKTGASVLGIETDPEMISVSKRRIRSEDLENRITVIGGNFKDIDKLARENNFTEVDGVMFDLGVSSYHFGSRNRGFSFRNPVAFLDMRLNPDEQNVTASGLLMTLRKDQMAALFAPVLGKRNAVKVSELIIRERENGPIKTVADLKNIVERSGCFRSGKLHPATKVFLALRMAVNGELENIEEALPKAFGLLRRGGKMVVISFHSLEDSLVKKYFSQLVKNQVGEIPDGEFVKPAEGEVRGNPLSRSAVLRAVRKI